MSNTLSKIRAGEIKKIKSYLKILNFEEISYPNSIEYIIDPQVKSFKPTNENIEDVRLVHPEGDDRADNHWESVAIKFSPNLQQEIIINFVIQLKCQEYLGKIGDYHIFLFD